VHDPAAVPSVGAGFAQPEDFLLARHFHVLGDVQAANAA
jgi:hypothetical protein